VARFLLVAHQTADRPELLAVAKELAAGERQAHFTLLVPATPISDLLTWEEGETKAVARARADSAAEALRSQGVNVAEVMVGDADPVLAVDDELRAGRPYEAVVVSTLPPGISRWVKMDVISRLRRTHPHLRLIHVFAKDAPSAE